MHCIGRYQIVDPTVQYEQLSDGSQGISFEELGRLEARALLTLLQRGLPLGQAELICAAKILGLKKEDWDTTGIEAARKCECCGVSFDLDANRIKWLAQNQGTHTQVIWMCDECLREE